LFHVGTQGIIEIFSPKGGCTYMNNYLANPMSSLVTTVFSIILLIFNLILIIINILLFIKEKGCSIKKFFITDDPYGFRFEQIIVLLTVLASILISILPLATTIGNPDVQVDSFSTRQQILDSLYAVFASFFEIALLISSCSVGLIYAIFSFFKRKLQSKVFENEFIAFINTKDGMKIFKEYAKTEWSMENVLFYEEVEKYRQMKKFKAAQKFAVQIKEKFIETGSILEVNLSGDCRKNTIKKIDNFDGQRRFSKYSCIFDEALKEAKRNMRDTFSRVRNTEVFKQWKSNSKVKLSADTKQDVVLEEVILEEVVIQNKEI
jgi:hypothetical protein